MAIRDILKVPHPMLKRVSVPVTRVDGRVRGLMDDMIESMYAADGIGLAAVQIGVPERVIVMDLARGDQDPSPIMLANPEIVECSDQLVPFEEGCLSVPGVFDSVERPDTVNIRYLDYDGRLIEREVDGLFAVCVQHEMDHLEGVLFIDHLSRLKRQRAVQKVKKARAREGMAVL